MGYISVSITITGVVVDASVVNVSTACGNGISVLDIEAIVFILFIFIIFTTTTTTITSIIIVTTSTNNNTISDNILIMVAIASEWMLSL